MLLDPGHRMLAFTALVALVGVVYECVAVRRCCRAGLNALLVVGAIYFVAVAAFIATSEMYRTQYCCHFEDRFESVVESSLWGDVAATVVIFLFSVVLRNTSMYDAYWSVFPPVIAAYWWSQSHDFNSSELLATIKSLQFHALSSGDARRCLEMVVYLLWGIRLTLNWARSWPGMGHADFRYLKGDNLPQPFGQTEQPFLHWLFSLLAFHLYPTVQVFGAMIPSAIVFYSGEDSDAQPLQLCDAIAFCVGFGAVVLQFVADNQLNSFRNRPNKQPGDVLCSGVWAYSRHPNYLGEVLFWFSHLLFGVAAADSQLPLTYLLCPSTILAMFTFASIPMMEARMLKRRPQYLKVMARVPMLLPSPQ